MLSLRSDTLFVMVLFHSVAFKTFYIQLLWNVNIVHVSSYFSPLLLLPFPPPWPGYDCKIRLYSVCELWLAWCSLRKPPWLSSALARLFLCRLQQWLHQASESTIKQFTKVIDSPITYIIQHLMGVLTYFQTIHLR